MPGKQPSVPPVAVISGAVLFSVTVMEEDAIQPEVKVAFTVYCPPVLTAGFWIEEVKLLGPVHDQALTVLPAVADNCAGPEHVTAPVTEAVAAFLPFTLMLPKR